MGAKLLYTIATERGTTPAAAEKELVRRVLAHTGTRDTSSLWEVTCTTMGTPDRKLPPIVIVAMSDAPPDTRYAITDGVVAETGPGLSALLKKASRYEARATRALRGAVFKLADLVVRVGLSFDRGSPVGVVVEVEVRACGRVELCAALAEELMGKVAAPLVPPPAAGADPGANAAATTRYGFERVAVDVGMLLDGEPPEFSHRHAALMYAKLLG